MDDGPHQTWKYHNTQPIPLGPHTPWPSRAEAGVKTFKARALILLTGYDNYDSLEPCVRLITIEEVVSDAADTRNDMTTYGGPTPNEIAFGARRPVVPELENMMPQQL